MTFPVKHHAVKRRPRLEDLPPPSFRPHRCALLAVDPGDCSGWAIYVDGRYVQSGFVDVHDREAVRKVVAALATVAELESAASDTACPMVLLLERPWSRCALGQARALWKGAWQHHGHSAKRVARAWPKRWRAQLFGSLLGPHAKRELIRAAELSAARRIAARADLTHPDEAAAVCQGKWGTQSGEVAKQLPQAYRGAA